MATLDNKLDKALDLDGMLWSVGGDLSFLREMGGLFLAACPTLLAEMRSAFDSGDLERAAEAAYLLKRSARNLSAKPTFAAAEHVEGHAQRGEYALALEAYGELESALELLKPELSRLLAGIRRPLPCSEI